MQIEYNTYAVGCCSHSERTAIQDGRKSPVVFPALCFVLKHPTKGIILFDTGFSSRFVEICKNFPDSLYNFLLPVKIKPEDDFASQLTKHQNIRCEEVKTIIISHFHVDHIAGLLDFPNARFICSRESYEAIKHLGRLGALVRAYCPKLMPADFADRCDFIENAQSVNLLDEISPFEFGYDLFADRSIFAVSLPGHAKGHFGVVFKNKNNETIFLVSDACWLSRAYKEFKVPHFITRLVHHNWHSYRKTLSQLHKLHKNRPEIKIIPSHCGEVPYEGQ